MIGKLADLAVEISIDVQVEEKVPLDMKAEAAEHTEKSKAMVEETKGDSVKLTYTVGAGDVYDTIIKVMKMGEEAPTEIFHKEGLAPCQEPMQHKVDMLAKKKPERDGVVKIVGVSIDKDTATLKNHVESKAWTSVEHYWRNESDCSDVYSVRGVPCVMLIDKEGQIVYKGHPAKRNIEEDLDNLVDGKVL